MWFIDAKGDKRVAHEGIEFSERVRLSADQSLLYVADYRGKWVWSFQVQPDGSVRMASRFIAWRRRMIRP